MSEENSIIDKFLSHVADFPEIEEVFGVNMTPEEALNAFNQVWSQKQSIKKTMSDDVEENVVDHEKIEEVTQEIKEVEKKSDNEYGERYREQQSLPRYKYTKSGSETEAKSKVSSNDDGYISVNINEMREMFGFKE